MSAETSFWATGVVIRAFGIYVLNLPRVLLLSLVICAPSVLLTALVVSPAEDLALTLPAVLLLLLRFVCLCWLQAALIHCLHARMGGQPLPRLAETLGLSLRVLPAMVVLSVFVILAVVAGLIVLIVPGLFLFALWWVAYAALVVERCGVPGALRRSRALTSGNRRRVVGLCVLTLVLTALAAGLGTVLPHIAGQSAVLYWLLPSMVGVLVFGFWVALVVVSYCDLRHLGEGDDEQARTGKEA